MTTLWSFAVVVLPITPIIKSLEEKHAREGGYSEKLLKKRLEYRSKI